MSENNQGQGSGRKRRRRRRRRKSGKKNSGSRRSNRKKSNRGRSGRNRRGGKSGNRGSGRNSGRNSRNKREKFGGREPKSEHEAPDQVKLNPFELFVSYYMGVTDDNRYSKPSMGNTARKYGIQPEDVEQALRNCGMDKHTLRDVDFDMSLAQLDIRVAPDGIDKREIAKGLFEEFVEVNPHFVDMTEEEICNVVDIDLEEE